MKAVLSRHRRRAVFNPMLLNVRTALTSQIKLD